MKRPVNRKQARKVIVNAVEEVCPTCGARLEIAQHRARWIERLDGFLHVVRRDKKCRNPVCPGPNLIFHAPTDLRLALPYRVFGLDITLALGERHLRGESLSAVQRDLGSQGIPIDQRHSGRLFRDFLALSSATHGDLPKVQATLRAQGGIVLMCDGVQFDDRAPVLYMAWDAISGMPLFGERKPFRGEDDLMTVLERVKAMEVPILGIVSDKESGLVPAVQTVFPKVPYHFCHTHFLKNCAKPLQADLSALGASVSERATQVQKIAKRLHEQDLAKLKVLTSPTPAQASTSESVLPALPSADPVSPTPVQAATSESAGGQPPASVDLPISSIPRPSPLSDIELAQQVCELARQNARKSGKAPLDPPELERHQRLEQLRELVVEVEKKRPRTGRKGAGSSKPLQKRSSPTGKRATKRGGSPDTRRY